MLTDREWHIIRRALLVHEQRMRQERKDDPEIYHHVYSDMIKEDHDLLLKIEDREVLMSP